jgi:hypothetical protein
MVGVIGDLVPDQETAISIASAVLNGIGYARWEVGYPLSQCEMGVRDEGDTWVVVWLPRETSPDKMFHGGGTPFFRIAKKDGQVRELDLMR